MGCLPDLKLKAKFFHESFPILDGGCFPDLKWKVKILHEKIQAWEITTLVVDPEFPRHVAFGNCKGGTALLLNAAMKFFSVCNRS